MKIGVVGPKSYFAPEVFESDDPRYLEDRATCFLRVLRNRLEGSGISLVHCDEVSPGEAWGYLFINHNQRFMTKLQRSGYRGKLFLIVFESALIQPDNWSEKIRSRYSAVFSWGRDEKMAQGGGQEIIPFFWPNPLGLAEQPLPFSDRKKLCVLMAANKWKRRPNELYTERFRAILWFMKNHPGEFDLYGYDWDISPAKKVVEYIRNGYRTLKGRQVRPINVSPVYKGCVPVKKDILKNYRFCICYENAENFPGYITEKIFDCFIAGVVPVYLGWDRVQEFIPQDTFIDKRKFPDYESLYDRLLSMGEEEYDRYLEAVGRFLSSEQAKRFDVSSFVEILLEGIGVKNFLKESNGP